MVFPCQKNMSYIDFLVLVDREVRLVSDEQTVENSVS